MKPLFDGGQRKVEQDVLACFGQPGCTRETATRARQSPEFADALRLLRRCIDEDKTINFADAQTLLSRAIGVWWRTTWTKTPTSVQMSCGGWGERSYEVLSDSDLGVAVRHAAQMGQKCFHQFLVDNREMTNAEFMSALCFSRFYGRE